MISVKHSNNILNNFPFPFEILGFPAVSYEIKSFSHDLSKEKLFVNNFFYFAFLCKDQYGNTSKKP